MAKNAIQTVGNPEYVAEVSTPTRFERNLDACKEEAALEYRGRLEKVGVVRRIEPLVEAENKQTVSPAEVERAVDEILALPEAEQDSRRREIEKNDPELFAAMTNALESEIMTEDEALATAESSFVMDEAWEAGSVAINRAAVITITQIQNEVRGSQTYQRFTEEPVDTEGIDLPEAV